MKQSGFGAIFLLIGIAIITALGGVVYFGKLPVKLPYSILTLTW